MLDGLPLRPGEEGGGADGKVGQHEEGEGEGVEDLLPGGAMDVSPLRHGGDGPQEEEGQVEAPQGLEDREAQGRKGAAAREGVDRRPQVDDGAGPRQDGGGHDVHGHVVAGEAAPEDAPDELAAVLPEDLEVALGPAHPLPPGLAEEGGLLIVENGVPGVADLHVPDHVVDGELNVLRQEEEVPAAALAEDLVGEEEARAADGAAGPRRHPGAV